MQCHGTELTEKLLFIKQDRWPLRGPKWNHHLSTSGNALQDVGGAAPLCDRSDGLGSLWGSSGCTWILLSKISQEEAKPGEERSWGTCTPSLSPCVSKSGSCKWPHGHNGGLVRCWPEMSTGNCVLTPGNTEPTASSPLDHSQLLLRVFAPRVLLVPPQGKHCPLCTSVSFFSARWKKGGLDWF